MKTNVLALLIMAMFVLSACASKTTTQPSVNSNAVAENKVSGSVTAELESNDCHVAISALEKELDSLKLDVKAKESDLLKSARKLKAQPDPAEEERINKLSDDLSELRKLIPNLYQALEEKKASCN